MNKLIFSFFLCIIHSVFSVIHVIGDSHSLEFEGIKNVLVYHIGPITMHRVGRDGLEIVDFRSFNIQENDIVVLAFGEIDVRCHIGRQRDLKNRDLDEIVETLIGNYLHTVLMNKSFYKHITVFLYTVTPPSDHAFNPDFPFYGNLFDRVHISKMLNQKLIEASEGLGFKVLDVYQDYADSYGALNLAYSDDFVHITKNHFIRNKLLSLLHSRE